MRSVLWTFGIGTTVFLKGTDDVSRHGDVDITLGVVLVQGESEVKGTSPIRGGFVVGLERMNKVVRVFFGNIFDVGIVNAQGERGGSCSVAPEAWSTWGGFVCMWGEVANKLVEGDNSCLFEAIHAV